MLPEEEPRGAQRGRVADLGEAQREGLAEREEGVMVEGLEAEASSLRAEERARPCESHY